MVILQKKVVGLSEESLSRFVTRARRESRLRGRVNVLVTGSAAMRTLNARFRGKNKSTDVLSFPSEQAISRGRAGFAGEIAISADIAAQNAARLGHSVASEVKVLALHGPGRRALFDAITGYDVVLTTYPLLLRDHEALARVQAHELQRDVRPLLGEPGQLQRRLLGGLEQARRQRTTIVVLLAGVHQTVDIEGRFRELGLSGRE